MAFQCVATGKAFPLAVNTPFARRVGTGVILAKALFNFGVHRLSVSSKIFAVLKPAATRWYLAGKGWVVPPLVCSQLVFLAEGSWGTAVLTGIAPKSCFR